MNNKTLKAHDSAGDRTEQLIEKIVNKDPAIFPGPLTTQNFLQREFNTVPGSTGAALNLFIDIVKTLSPKDEDGKPIYLFEYEANDFMDLKANRMERSTSGIHLPEIEAITRYTGSNGLKYVSYQLRPYFFKWGQFGEQVSHGDTRHSLATQDKSIGRQKIRDEIESEIVLPLVHVLEQSGDSIYTEVSAYYSLFIRPTASIQILYPIPWFTGHEVGIQLGFNLTLPTC